jgi:hypothetical protein
MWWSSRAIKLHAVIIVIVPTFGALCAWQVSRALSGNELSWAYVFEWPFFAGYAIYMWWRFLHEAPPEAAPAVAADHTGTSPEAPRPSEIDQADDDERAAYNQYLAQLATRGKRKQWR